MAKTIKELKEFLNQFNEDEKFYIAVDNDNEVTCEFMTESEIIDKANEMGGYEEEETEDKLKLKNYRRIKHANNIKFIFRDKCNSTM